MVIFHVIFSSCLCFQFIFHGWPTIGELFFSSNLCLFILFLLLSFYLRIVPLAWCLVCVCVCVVYGVKVCECTRVFQFAGSFILIRTSRWVAVRCCHELLISWQSKNKFISLIWCRGWKHTRTIKNNIIDGPFNVGGGGGLTGAMTSSASKWGAMWCRLLSDLPFFSRSFPRTIFTVPASGPIVSYARSLTLTTVAARNTLNAR